MKGDEKMTPDEERAYAYALAEAAYRDRVAGKTADDLKAVVEQYRTERERLMNQIVDEACEHDCVVNKATLSAFLQADGQYEVAQADYNDFVHER
jgi:hypothetical protein